MKRTLKLTRKQIKNAKELLEKLQDHKPVRRKRKWDKKTKLVKALKKEVKRQETNTSKVAKPRKTKPMFSLSRYLERKEEKKHEHKHGHHH